jgi:hypothetical protein
MGFNKELYIRINIFYYTDKGFAPPHLGHEPVMLLFTSIRISLCKYIYKQLLH